MENKKIQKRVDKLKNIGIIILGYWTLIFALAYLTNSWDGFPKIFLGIPIIILAILSMIRG